MEQQEEFDKQLHALLSAVPESVLEASSKIYRISISSEIRDLEWPSHMYDNLYSSMLWCWTETCSDSPSIDVTEIVLKAEKFLWSAFKAISSFPEFDVNGALNSRVLNSKFLQTLVRRAVRGSGYPGKGGSVHIRQCLHWLYLNKMSLRGHCRSQLCIGLLQQGGGRGRMSDSGHSRDHVAPLLDVLACILEGICSPLDKVYSDLLNNVLLPLHQPNEMIEWRDQIPVIQSYYNPLLRCMTTLLSKANNFGVSDAHSHVHSESNRELSSSSGQSSVSFFCAMIGGIVQQWPQSFASNTPKEVLLLDEIEKIIALANPEQFAAALPQIILRISTCVGGDADNFRTVQRTLQIFKNKRILALIGGVKYTKEMVFVKLIPALYRGGKLSWNPTVNKMTALALRNFRDIDPEEFTKVANSTIAVIVNNAPTGTNMNSSTNISTGSRFEGHSHSHFDSDANDHSAKRMRPPVGRMAPPSIPVAPNRSLFSTDNTGLPAPTPAATNPSTMPPPSNWRSRQGGQPPVTITGVAPWAMTTAKPGGAMATTNATTSSIMGVPRAARGVFNPQTVLPPIGPSAVAGQGHSRAADGNNTMTQKHLHADEIQQGHSDARLSGIDMLLEYMDKCLPPQLRESEKGSVATDNEGDWNLVQAAATPTLLPSLKFHDLVFGHELGRGSFGVVRYARRINREKTRSDWHEFAVKIISAEKLAEQSYQPSIIREIAVLQVLSHPGIARLVSTFRYTSSAYLVLEYASRGDLHDLVLKCRKRMLPVAGRGMSSQPSSPLDHNCTRFIVGEVASALLFIHEMGFCYNDLKPENILITEIGHVKIADFGACRGYTPAGKELLRDSLKTFSIETMRNGDWRDVDADSSMKPSSPTSPSSASLNNPKSNDIGDAFTVTREVDGDERIEGTPAYLPPEVLRGQEAPGPLSDAWSLGCVAAFCLRGRPLYFGSVEEVLNQQELDARNRDSQLQRGVHFGADMALGGCHPNDSGHEHNRKHNKDDGIRGGEGDGDAAAGADDLSENFINALLSHDPQWRMSVSQAVNHEYLTAGRSSSSCASPDADPSLLPMEPLKLHFSPPVVELPSQSRGGQGEDGSGSNGSGGDDDQLWARRQFSVIWAPMPSDLKLHGYRDHPGGDSGDWEQQSPLTAYDMIPIPETDLERSCPFIV